VVISKLSHTISPRLQARPATLGGSPLGVDWGLPGAEKDPVWIEAAIPSAVVTMVACDGLDEELEG
jgi:hypothetical protein